MGRPRDAAGVRVGRRGLVEEAVERLAEAAHPAKVILFGSAARGELGEDSDLDFVVILKEVRGRKSEMVRLLAALRPLRVPVDVLVYTDEEVQEWGHLPGTVLFEALTEGRVVYEAA